MVRVNVNSAVRTELGLIGLVLSVVRGLCMVRCVRLLVLRQSTGVFAIALALHPCMQKLLIIRLMRLETPLMNILLGLMLVSTFKFDRVRS